MLLAWLTHAFQTVKHLGKGVGDEEVLGAFPYANHRVHATQGYDLLATMTLYVLALIVHLDTGTRKARNHLTFYSHHRIFAESFAILWKKLGKSLFFANGGYWVLPFEGLIDEQRQKTHVWTTVDNGLDTCSRTTIR